MSIRNLREGNKNLCFMDAIHKAKVADTSKNGLLQRGEATAFEQYIMNQANVKP